MQSSLVSACFATDQSARGGLKRAVPVASEDSHRARQVVGHGEVQITIAAEVPYGNGLGFGTVVPAPTR